MNQRRLHFRAGTDDPALLRAQAEALFDRGTGRPPPEQASALADFIAAAQACGNELQGDAQALAKLLHTPLFRYQIEGTLIAGRFGRALVDAGVVSTEPVEPPEAADAPAPAASAGAADRRAPLVDSALQWVRALSGLQQAAAAGLLHTDPATGARQLRPPVRQPDTLLCPAQGLNALRSGERR